MLYHQARQNVKPRTREHFDVDFFHAPDASSIGITSLLLVSSIWGVSVLKSSADTGDMSLASTVDEKNYEAYQCRF